MQGSVLIYEMYVHVLDGSSEGVAVPAEQGHSERATESLHQVPTRGPADRTFWTRAETQKNREDKSVARGTAQRIITQVCRVHSSRSNWLKIQLLSSLIGQSSKV